MAIATGSTGELRYRGQRAAKCRNFTLDISRDALETTSIGSYDRTFAEGIRGATGSGTILYDDADSSTLDLLNVILANGSAEVEMSLVLNTANGKLLDFTALLTQVSTPVSVGEVVACSVNFQVTGGIRGAF